jgi:hypothetical protein
VKCFVDVSGRIQRVILGTMIRKLRKLKLGWLIIGVFLMWKIVGLG